MKLCKRCNQTITGRGVRWCSKRCSQLGLKRLYKQRNHDKILAYNRQYKKQHVVDHSIGIVNNQCYFCHYRFFPFTQRIRKSFD